MAGNGLVRCSARVARRLNGAIARRAGGAKSLIALAIVLPLAAAAETGRLPIREARWAAPDRLYPSLIHEPAECLVPPSDPLEQRAAAIGRAAFRAPLLLGGQAARVGMSCATCHRNGRGNPDFLFHGLSGDPGTADVTSSLMSAHRGDGHANPVPIPDLGGSRAVLKISRNRDGALERFIRGLVVEEFDGPEPAPAVLAGLAAYVRALRPEGCGGSESSITLADRLRDVEEAVRLAGQSQGATRRFLVAAARSALGGIDERFAVPGLERDRTLLRGADKELLAIRAGAGFERWARGWTGTKQRLLRDERRSLFDPLVLRQALAAGLSPAPGRAAGRDADSAR
ncbi:MAG: hypothetical protein JWN69_2141 [Alphaproteobacteria bacterium]|nr:hypothetical protein [Alphaproteobacteria bacterium]